MSGVNKIISLGRAKAAAATRTQISRPLPATTEVVKSVTASETVTTMPKQEVSWMRDPKTGYWAPEDSFDAIDVAELRAHLLSMKK
ncbi:Late embryogenesis abundant protein [Carex littledalei]|uniref:Late embryogenesis abundant protein n=1 Tax=Carex littledalei TaxID=544730 RepID=A0A833REX8_9POAL|nr:Late embryogenesis abundant protein [Carex littledalei]